MYALSPLTCYQQALDAGNYQADNAQYQAMQALEIIYCSLSERQLAKSSEGDGVVDWLRKKLGKPAKSVTPVTGLYMWGGVGRGKTWLMDLFFHSLPGQRKLRLHFHRFMLRVHELLTLLQGQPDPLEKVADDFKAQADILCFDEFFVTDITDAMLLGTLFEALFARGITLVATSNTPPDRLYHNGLQRTCFLPAIALIKQHCQVMNVDAGVDYRLRTLTRANLFISPLERDTDEIMQALFRQLAGGQGGGAKVLEINHRELQVINVSDGVLAVNFAVLCEEARSQMDYIVLSRLYHSILLHHVHPMGLQYEDTARRFIALVDEFYERRVKLMISSEVEMAHLYQGTLLRFEFQRCFSRLQEMQSEGYLQLEHLP